MERDSHRRFRDIHGSRENLISSVNDILEKALVKVVEDNAPMSLRYITPHQLSTGWLTDEHCSEYALTLPGELPPGEEYISVSYTWAHSQEIDPSTPIPDYRIKDQATPDAPFRSINCPTMVFHRAWYFARARGIPYVWIDQECIYQDNTEDKERHLQIMDKIYEKSKRTVAILSKEVPDTMLSALSQLLFNDSHKLYGAPHYNNWLLDVDFFPIFNHLTKDRMRPLVSYILSDRWFTRAWTFQENHCASACEFLVPVRNKGDTAVKLASYLIGDDVSLTFRCMLDWMNIDQSRYLLSGVASISPDINLVSRPLHSLLYEKHPSFPAPHSILFGMMEKCDNLICSDRLTIFANACGFRHKLNSTILNDVKYSYSTCMIALIMANEVENEDSAVEDGIQELDPDTRMYWKAMVATTKKIKIWELDLDKPIAEALRKMGVIDEFD